MQIRFDCPTDKCVAIIEFEPLESCGDTMKCPRCHTEHNMYITTTMRKEHCVDQCAVCGGRELFIRKDFPQKLGLLIVLVFGAAAIYYFNKDLLTSWAILASAILLDLAVYYFIGKVTTCYACRAEYRRCVPNTTHEGFDLATSEKY